MHMQKYRVENGSMTITDPISKNTSTSTTMMKTVRLEECSMTIGDTISPISKDTSTLTTMMKTVGLEECPMTIGDTISEDSPRNGRSPMSKVPCDAEQLADMFQ